MKAMIWKEIRENLKWAVLGMLGIAIAIVYSRSRSGWYSYWEGDASLCSANFLMIMTFGSAAAGVALGLLQTLRESRRDQWAFLI
ncbi:MAG: hypothetical protein IID43_04915, partial [Planctomycetes bacterium]|nr:hypothetical protein [Planctomycetota bacterium]